MVILELELVVPDLALEVAVGSARSAGWWRIAMLVGFQSEARRNTRHGA